MRPLEARNYPLISLWVHSGARVLDLGCGTGELLLRLRDERQVEGIGVEIAEEMVVACLQNGVNVYQGDMGHVLGEFETASFDTVILNATLQEVTRPVRVINEMLRVGREAIITVTNFGYVRNRLKILLSGHPGEHIRKHESWNDTPVIRFVSLREFSDTCADLGIEVAESRFFLPLLQVPVPCPPGCNLWCREGVFLLRGKR